MIEAFLPDTAIYVQLIRFLAVLVAGILVTKVVLMPLARKAVKKKGGDKVSMHSFENIVGLVGLFLSFILALQGAELGNLVTVLGAITAALTVAVGFGMRDQIGNIVAGFFILTCNPFVKGDYITTENHEGVVKEIKLRHTTINGSSSEKIILPNSLLTTQPLKNFTKGRLTKVSKEFKIDVKKAERFEEICAEEASKNDKVLEKPAPGTTVEGLEEDKASIRLDYHVRDSEDVKSIRSDLNRDIVEKSLEENIFDKKEEK